MTLHGRLETVPDAEALARAAAESFTRLAGEAVRSRGRFAVALTGGSSPVRSYHLLADPEFAERIPWKGVHLFWGDERAVPPAHPRSNYGMAHEALVRRVPIPEGNVHRVRGELGAERAAAEYARELREVLGPGIPRLDLVHLGLGGDGHVASLFPFDHACLTERERTVVTSIRQPLGEPRVSLTLPVLNAARRVEFLLPSEDKAGIARRAMRGPLDPFRIPAQLVRPRDGELVWLATEAVVQGER